MGPETALIFATVASASAAAVQGVSAYRAARFNEASLRSQAETTRRISQIQAERLRKQQRRVVKKQIAGLAKTGGLLSGEDVIFDTILEGESAAADALISGFIQAEGLKRRAAITRAQGNNALIAGGIGVGTAVFSGFALKSLVSGGGGSNAAFIPPLLPAGGTSTIAPPVIN